MRPHVIAFILSVNVLISLGNVLAADLFTASASGDVKRVNELLSEMQKDKSSRTSLTTRSQAELVRIPLNSDKVHINSKDKTGNTPLHLATKNGRARVVEVLLAAGADTTIKDSNGLTPPNIVSQKVKVLLAAGADATIKDSNGLTLPNIAPQKVEVLLAAGADTTIKDSNGLTPPNIAPQKVIEIFLMFKENLCFSDLELLLFKRWHNAQKVHKRQKLSSSDIEVRVTKSKVSRIR